MTQLVVPDTTELQTESQAICKLAKGFLVETATGYEEAGEFLVAVREVRKRIEDTFKVPIADANRAHKSMIAAMRRHDDPLKEAEVTVKNKRVAWKRAEDARREAEERKAREAARKAEEARIAAEAEALAAEDRTEEAVALLEQPVVTPPVVFRDTTPKTEGLSTRTNWKWRITDRAAIPREFFVLDEKAVNAIVRAQKGATDIPGIEAYPEETEAIRT